MNHYQVLLRGAPCSTQVPRLPCRPRPMPPINTTTLPAGHGSQRHDPQAPLPTGTVEFHHRHHRHHRCCRLTFEVSSTFFPPVFTTPYVPSSCAEQCSTMGTKHHIARRAAAESGSSRVHRLAYRLYRPIWRHCHHPDQLRSRPSHPLSSPASLMSRRTAAPQPVPRVRPACLGL